MATVQAALALAGAGLAQIGILVIYLWFTRRS